MNVRANGFTLIEIAIVLVIIGLLLGGVLKGQELITGARVRNLISQQDGIKAAFFGFQDRYRALPGDYASASTNINCPAPALLNGNGNGRIEAPTHPAVVHEELLAWSHLTGAGFLNGSFAAGSGDAAPTDAITPRARTASTCRSFTTAYTETEPPPRQAQPEDRKPNARGDHRRGRPQNRRRKSAVRRFPIFNLRPPPPL